MNVELVNPTLILGLFAGRDAAGPEPSRWRARARLGERLRWRRAPRERHRLDHRDLAALDRPCAEVAAPAWRHARGLEPPART